MPSIQPRELWEETGRWQKFGGQLLKIRDRKDGEFCYGPTHEEVITDFARNELKSYRQLPLNFYQIQTKFRDEIRPRFGAMRAREFLMKDAYSFHLDAADLEREYWNMHAAYSRIFQRLGLSFRAVKADSGAIGGDASQEFHVLADSGEDAIAFSDGSSYAANVEAAAALDLQPPTPISHLAAGEHSTPTQKTIAEVSSLLGVEAAQCVKTLVFHGSDGLWALCVRGDDEVNLVKAAKAIGAEGELRLATDDEIKQTFGCEPGFIGPILPVGAGAVSETVSVVVDRSARLLKNFVCGANRSGTHIVASWEDARITRVDDLRTIRVGDPSPDGQGTLGIARGIEVGHVFQLGQKYAEAMGATVLDEAGKARIMFMGCYGIGVSRIVAAAIEQNYDASGICWPAPMAPWQVAICIINPKRDSGVDAAAQGLCETLTAAGIDTCMDDRGLRPGAMFADIELIGIPHRVVISERGLQAGTYEYRARRAEAAEALDLETLLQRLGVGAR
jgi:prolyl-tRNA synthetase